MVEILNVCIDYYSDDTNERNFVLIPSDTSEILIEPENKIYCKIIPTEKNLTIQEIIMDKIKNLLIQMTK